jgi:hypothetical protein
MFAIRNGMTGSSPLNGRPATLVDLDSVGSLASAG